MNDSDRIEHISAAILAYLAIRPQAADTVEGVHQWWVNWAGQEAPIHLTEQALETLAEQGKLQFKDVAGKRIWRKA
ncbi:hypothetical protein [Gallaecimonas mangrovi]|uniref:hypothetical protein n=1 Tax=Gallaecimonas mangrovi TaxID=2291597 RepID=UPI000E2069EB|nr:hypothetical protein [Gallaecimonas mangrovi]